MVLQNDVMGTLDGKYSYGESLRGIGRRKKNKKTRTQHQKETDKIYQHIMMFREFNSRRVILKARQSEGTSINLAIKLMAKQEFGKILRGPTLL